MSWSMRYGVTKARGQTPGYAIWDKIFGFHVPPTFDSYQLPDLGLGVYSPFPDL